MESLALLEKKLSQLVSLVHSLKDKNASLAKENADLKKKYAALENEMLDGVENIEALTSEKEKTKVFVSDLIKSLDKLVETGNQL